MMLAKKFNKNQKVAQMSFNCLAIKAVFLRDDILVLSYETKTGGIEELVFPDLLDADHFFCHTLHNYRSGRFNQNDLDVFLSNIIKPIKAKILTAASGFGNCSVTYARFIIIQAVAMINLTKKVNQRECFSRVIKV